MSSLSMCELWVFLLFFGIYIYKYDLSRLGGQLFYFRMEMLLKAKDTGIFHPGQHTTFL